MNILAAALIAPALILLPAHATVVETNPTDGETLTAISAPFEVTVNEDILSLDDGSADANAMTITDASGLFYGDGCVAVDGATLATGGAVELGEAGQYTLTYQLVSADGHAIDGQIPFEWAPEGDASGTAGSPEAPVCDASASEDASGTAIDPATTETGPQSESNQGESSDAAPGESATTGEASEDGSFPYVLVGAVALLAVAGIIIMTWRRGSRRGLGGDDQSAPRDESDPRD